MPPSPLLLVGFMGSGKTTTGRLLAQRLGWFFCDLDERIETAAGASIAAIFAHQGETAFRALEREQMEQVLALSGDRHRMIVALGGGTFAQPGNLEYILASSAFTIFLDIPVDVLLMRCAQMTNRPLFRDEASFRHLYQQRLPFYRRAHLTIAAREDPPEAIVERILAQWQGPAASLPVSPAPARELFG